jgi:hypothetical protein
MLFCLTEMKIFYRLTADIICLIHLLVVILVLFGWLILSLWYVYMLVLVGTLFSELWFTYCFLSKWEFDLRRKTNPALDYDYSYTSYYTYKLTRQHLSTRFLARAGIVFTTLSLAINIFFKFWY